MSSTGPLYGSSTHKGNKCQMDLKARQGETNVQKINQGQTNITDVDDLTTLRKLGTQGKQMLNGLKGQTR